MEVHVFDGLVADFEDYVGGLGGVERDGGGGEGGWFAGGVLLAFAKL